MILTEFSPWTPERTSRTLSRICCEKFQLTPTSVRDRSSFIASISSGFVRAPPARSRRLDLGPPLLRPERDEELGAVEARRVGAAVGPAELGGDELRPPGTSA